MQNNKNNLNEGNLFEKLIQKVQMLKLLKN